MPCQSDYMEPSGVELESQRVCQLLVYLWGRLFVPVPKWVQKAAKDYYGNKDRLDEATKLLCSALCSLDEKQMEEYVYDAHNKEARRLAGWWERHQEWDERRVKEEDEARRKVILRGRALKKLTVEEMKALGLVDDNDVVSDSGEAESLEDDDE